MYEDFFIHRHATDIYYLILQLMFLKKSIKRRIYRARTALYPLKCVTLITVLVTLARKYSNKFDILLT